jgi:hypothetical protein
MIGGRARAGAKQSFVSGLPGEDGYTLYCEPEGAEQQVAPGDVLMLTFSADKPHGFEISRVTDGIMLCRLGDSDVTIEDKRGRSLRW